MNTANLQWVLPTTRVDGSALASTDIASVKVFDSVAGADPVLIGTVTLDPKTAFATPALVPGSHVFMVEVLDQNGTTSGPSNTASLVVPAPAPAAPSPATDLTATLVLSATPQRAYALGLACR